MQIHAGWRKLDPDGHQDMLVPHVADPCSQKTHTPKPNHAANQNPNRPCVPVFTK